MADHGENYPWYRCVNGSVLEQGDILFNCPMFVISIGVLQPGAGPSEVRVDLNDAIVMTQSCDLAPRKGGRPKVDDVILCPLYQRQTLATHPTYKDSAKWEQARQGQHAGFHVLNKCELPGHEMDYALVDLRRAYSLNVELVQKIAGDLGNRIRLQPPYREHLSQSFARFFMRVGLPIDIPPFR